jgi:hydrogenase maturation protease
MTAPILIFGYGNPSRGDDALGPAFLERIDALRTVHPEWPGVELLTDFQLQVEHVLDMKGREFVLFVDAHATTRPPFSCERICPSASLAYTTHAMTPAELLHLYARVVGSQPPPSFLLGIRGEHFELGEPVSDAAAHNLECAVVFTAELLGRRDTELWFEPFNSQSGQCISLP